MKQFNDVFDIDGYWWLPENPTKTVAGTLHYSPEKMSLNLIGAFADIKESLSRFECPIILGFSTGGKSITLYKSYSSNFSMSNPSLPSSSYAVLQLFIGHHFQKEDELKFSKIFVHLTHFDEWIGISGFFMNLDSIKENKISITYSQPKEIKFSINETFSITIGFGYSINTKNNDEKEQSIQQRTGITIETENDLPFIQFLNVLSDIRQFLGLACLHPIHPLEVTGLMKSNEQKIDGQTINPSIEIYFQQHKMPTKIKELHSMHMLFTCRDISHDVGHYFKKWFENKSVLEPIYNLYSEVLHKNEMAIDQQFLLLIHAVEAYHRRTSDETEIDESAHKQRISEIITSVPDHYKDWLKTKLQFSNELSLPKRLDILLTQFPFILENFDVESKLFIRKIADVRNYLTHYSNKAKSELDDRHKLFDMCQRLKLLIESSLLYQLGFENSKIAALIEKSKFIKGLKDPV